jgi:hypothetical protein
MHTTSIVQSPSLTLAFGITIPDSKMAREAREGVSYLFSRAICRSLRYGEAKLAVPTEKR